jgi:ketosteroid isomerase-like protein
MSQQDVDTIKGAYEAFGRGDIPGVLAVLHDDAEWDVPASVPWGGVSRGPEEVGAFFGRLMEYFDEFTVTPAQFLDAGDHVVVLCELRGRAKDGGDMEARSAMVWRMRDGKAEHFRDNADTAAMTAALPAATA